MIKYINYTLWFFLIFLSLSTPLEAMDDKDKIVNILENQNELKKDKLSDLNDRKETRWQMHSEI